MTEQSVVSSSISFTKPSFNNADEEKKWEENISSTILEIASNENRKQELVVEQVSKDIVALFESTQNQQVVLNISTSLSLLFHKNKTAALMYTNAGVIPVLVKVCKESNDEKVLIPTMNSLVPVTEPRRNIPPVATALLQKLISSLSSTSKDLRISAAYLLVSLFNGGFKIWDEFISSEGMTSLKTLFLANDNTEILPALRLLQFIADNDHYMLPVRRHITFERLVACSESSNEQIAYVAKDILKECKYEKIKARESSNQPRAAKPVQKKMLDDDE